MDLATRLSRLSPLLILALLLLPALCLAQQNLFNVPSADITEAGQFFFQQQFNIISANSGTSNTTLDYGLGRQLEIGLNLFNLDMQTTNGSYQNPHILLNFQKGHTFNQHYKIGFGSQSGLTPALHGHTTELPSFNYINNAVDLQEHGKYFLGGYFANQAYASKNQFGFMAGAEYPLIHHKIHLMADFISGDNDLSVAVIGAAFHLSHHWQISLGAQLPAPTSHNDYGLVLEITQL
ncbi:hypothetical protein KFZ76_19970 [Methylovulum psychrotolerans]|uniref:hypothetical protein n=1 Tax=Methylovulum psychrotolerans TaxID=1704499 RepID=UPI001BFF5B1D|nr:hypothetical protein [Methylovulum psychrotolerans]MBT9099981.1 hypothetical protein [Methylovulum psychrotolerans]